MSSIVARKRPKHLNLLQIRLPVAGIISIMHRVSGAVLFLLIPLLLYLFQLSLQSGMTYMEFQDIVRRPLVKLILLGLLWGYLHHLFAGLRHLFLDLHIGISLEASRLTSIIVLVLGIALTLLIGVRLW